MTKYERISWLDAQERWPGRFHSVLLWNEEHDCGYIQMHNVEVHGVGGIVTFEADGKHFYVSESADRVSQGFTRVDADTIEMAEKAHNRPPLGEAMRVMGGHAHNYFHFWTDAVARLALAPGVSTGQPSTALLVPPLDEPFQREVLALAGYGSRPKHEIRMNDSVIVQTLYFLAEVWGPTLEEPHSELAPFFRGIRSNVIDDAVPCRRIYVRRRPGGRCPANEQELEALLVQRGFECFSLERMRVRDQIRLFAEAEMVVAPHGAGLTNLLFASPFTRVLELRPSVYQSKCFEPISKLSGATHHVYVEPNSSELLRTLGPLRHPLGARPRRRDAGDQQAVTKVDLSLVYGVYRRSEHASLVGKEFRQRREDEAWDKKHPRTVRRLERLVGLVLALVKTFHTVGADEAEKRSRDCLGYIPQCYEQGTLFKIVGRVRDRLLGEHEDHGVILLREDWLEKR